MATKIFALRRDGECSICSTQLPAGTKAQWDSVAKVVTCLECVAGSTDDSADLPPPVVFLDLVADPVSAEPSPIERGVAGGSAEREYERRHAKHEQRIEEKWGSGRIGKIAKFLADDPQTTTAWAAGGRGERRVAEVLEERFGERAVLLNDRKVPGTRGNIDHIAIGPSGVWVIDAKKYKGRVVAKDVGGLFRTDVRLYVNDRDQTKLVRGLDWQREAATRALGRAGLSELPVHCALSFVGADWPLFFAKPLSLQDVWISWPGKLADLILDAGPLDPAMIDRAARLLAVELPAYGS